MDQTADLSTLKFEKPSCWKKRPSKEKILIFVSAVLAILIIIFLVITILNKINSDATKHKVCLTSGCIKAANEVFQKIDSSINPCEDFYEFACGNFAKNVFLPPGFSQISPLGLVSNTISKKMKKLFEMPIRQTEFRPLTLAKTLYQACHDINGIELHAMDNIRRIFDETGGWPVISNGTWNEGDFDWKNTIYKLHKMGFGTGFFVTVDIAPSFDNSSLYSLTLDQVGIEHEEIKRKSGFEDPIIQAYYNYMVKVAVVFGADQETAKRDMREAIDLEIQIAKVLIPPEERRDSFKENNKMTIRDLERTFSFIPWLQYFNNMMSPYANVTYDDIVIVKTPKFLHEMENILKITNKKIIANYMYWQVFNTYVRYLNKQLKDLEIDYLKTAEGIVESPERWKQCTNETEQLYVTSGALYIRNVFKSGSKAAVTEIAKRLKEEFKNNLKVIDWMDSSTKQHAQEKIGRMSLFVAHEEELLDDEKVIEYHKDYNFDSKDYLGIILNLGQIEYKEKYEKFAKRIVNTTWVDRSYIIDTNAYYIQQANGIEILAGILDDALFEIDRPKYMNFAAIGSVIGHEITHGFDDEGKQFNKDGDLINWWNNKTQKVFSEKAQCIVDQYGNITVPEVNLKINGINTQGENIADNGGVKFSYNAYKKWVSEYGEETFLPGLPYSPLQMFWISYGNTWCQIIKTESLKLTVLEDSHSPNKYRVNVPLMNSADFANDFQCPLGSPMNPKGKCHVW